MASYFFCMYEKKLQISTNHTTEKILYIYIYIYIYTNVYKEGGR